jgi:recombination protein RecT
MATATKPDPGPAPPAKKPAALAVIDERTVLPAKQLLSMGDRLVPQLAMALPKMMAGNADRFLRTLVTEVQRNYQLQKCTSLSLIGAMMQSAQFGLEIGSTLGQAYLVPYWNHKVKGLEAQFQIGYRGMQQLAHRSGLVKNFFAHPVYAADAFDIRYGSDPIVIHTPSRKPLAERGALLGFYAVLNTTTGGTDVEFMTREEIEEHRDRYSKAKAKNEGDSGRQGPWVTHFDEMAKKTVIRKIGKRSPMSVDLVHASVLSEHDDEGFAQDLRLKGAEALALDISPERSGVAEAIEGQIDPQPVDDQNGEG